MQIAKRGGIDVDALLLEKAAGEQAATFVCDYFSDPVAFVSDCFDWQASKAGQASGPAPYQIEALSELAACRRYAVRGPHGLGKTALSAWAVLWFALTRDAAGIDWKVPTTASAWRQLKDFLWPEITKWARRLDWDAVKWRGPFNERTELLSLSLQLQHGAAFALASDNSVMIEGAHASELFYLFDESKAIPPDTWDSAEGAFSSGQCYWLAVSTPGEPAGRFYDIHARKPGYGDWTARHVTLQETVAAGRVSSDWSVQRAEQWGEESAVYQNRVLGEFASSDEDSVIPLAWIEAAVERWHDRKEQPREPLTALGVDFGRVGDKTVFAFRYGSFVDSLTYCTKEPTPASVGRIKGILDVRGGKAVVDGIGLGSTAVDLLREEPGRYTIDAFIASHRSELKDKSGELGYANRRAAAWWNLREMLEPGSPADVCLPPDDVLIGDLTAPRYRVLSGGKILIEAKEEIKKRLGRSTDAGDSVVQAFALPEPQEVVVGVPPSISFVSFSSNRPRR